MKDLPAISLFVKRLKNSLLFREKKIKNSCPKPSYLEKIKFLYGLRYTGI